MVVFARSARLVFATAEACAMASKLNLPDLLFPAAIGSLRRPFGIEERKIGETGSLSAP